MRLAGGLQGLTAFTEDGSVCHGWDIIIIVGKKKETKKQGWHNDVTTFFLVPF